jgi:thioredoxin 1
MTNARPKRQRKRWVGEREGGCPSPLTHSPHQEGSRGRIEVSKVARVTDKTFETEVLAADLPVLVEFWGSWCPPCKMMEPTLEQLAADYDGRLAVGKINIDQNPRTAAEYGIQGAPTFIVFHAGEVRGRRTGAQSEGQLENLLEESGVFGLEKKATHEEDEIRERLRALGYVE